MTSTFEESSDRFRDFLTKNGYSDKIIWITPEDVSAGEGRLYVKLPVPAENVRRVRELFERAMELKSGIVFKTVCELRDATCCKAWVPADEEERQRAFCPRDLKLSALTGKSRLPGEEIRSALRWFYLRVRNRKRDTRINDLFWG